MSTPRYFFDLCLSECPEKNLAKVSDATLAMLYEFLGTYGVRSGVPGLIAGLVEIEIARRWVAENRRQPGAVGEGDA